jgi:nucleoside-diphosphate-sugar epimerase
MTTSMAPMLVTGATGFLGRHVVAALRAVGYAVLAPVGRRMPTRDGYLAFDIDVPETMRAANEVGDLGAIIHLAARVDLESVDRCTLLRANGASTGELACIAASRGIGFVYASSVAALGSNVVGPYGQSKLAGEKAVFEAGCRACCLRFSGIFGARGPHHLGVNRSIDRAMEGMTPIRAGSGTARRNYVYVRDAAQAVVFAATSGIVGTHIVAGSEESSIRDMLQSICDVFLPGSVPDVAAGSDGHDQVFRPSDEFPCGMTFRQALNDILVREQS